MNIPLADFKLLTWADMVAAFDYERGAGERPSLALIIAVAQDLEKDAEAEHARLFGGTTDAGTVA